MSKIKPGDRVMHKNGNRYYVEKVRGMKLRVLPASLYDDGIFVAERSRWIAADKVIGVQI